MYNQIVNANLSVVGVPEECLAYVRAVFGATFEYPTAIEGWENAQYKHESTPPSNLSVPIWFSYNGPDGHVAVWVSGTIYSTTKYGDRTFPSIEALITWMGEDFVYLGWSEDVDKLRVVQPSPAPTPSGSTVIEINPGTWNVRTGAGLASPIINVAHGGQKYGGAVIESNGWAQIIFTNRVGYISPAGYTKI